MFHSVRSGFTAIDVNGFKTVLIEKKYEFGDLEALTNDSVD